MAKRRKKRKSPVKHVCRFCAAGVERIDYKDIPTLQKLTTPQGKILGRKRMGHCNKHQKMIKRAIKRARIMALMPFVKLY
ncbi:MAG: 30S ribosomal protein S18 [Planctomycetota bacterium]|nr:MAG: 30S ribosomal protein S18 [Planctomycetota bacterium]